MRLLDMCAVDAVDGIRENLWANHRDNYSATKRSIRATINQSLVGQKPLSEVGQQGLQRKVCGYEKCAWRKRQSSVVNVRKTTNKRNILIKKFISVSGWKSSSKAIWVKPLACQGSLLFSRCCWMDFALDISLDRMIALS